MDDDGGADADAGRAGHADETRVHTLGRTVAEMRDIAGGLGVRDDAGQLRRQRHQKCFFALVETAPVPLLHDEHAEYATLLDDRHAEERVERFLADLRQVVKVRMARRVFEIDRFGAAADERDQPLPALQIKMSDRGLVEAFGRNEQEAVAGRVDEIDRTDFRAHRLADARDDDVERVTKRRRRIDVLNDAAQGTEHGVACPLAPRGHDQPWRKFLQRLPVNITFELDHLTDGVPVADPTPIVELRFHGAVYTDAFVARDHLAAETTSASGL